MKVKRKLNRRVFYLLLLAVAIAALGWSFNKNNIRTHNNIEPKNSLKLRKAGVVNVYSSRKEELIKDLFAAFTVKHNIKVNYIIDEAPKLIARIESEGKNTEADVFLTADIINLLLAEKKSLLRPIKSEILENNISADLRDDYWIALTKRTRLLVYAKDRVNPNELSTYEDLSSAKWKKRLVMRSSNNSYNQSLLASIIAADGEQEARRWVRGIVANFVRHPSGGDTDQIRAVAAGEGDVTIANSYYIARILASSEPEDRKIASKIGIFFPNQYDRGTMLNISGAGITKYSKNPANAIALLEFMISTEAQEMYAKKNQEYPVLETAQISKIISAWGTYKTDQTPLKDLAKYMQLATEIADQEGWK